MPVIYKKTLPLDDWNNNYMIDAEAIASALLISAGSVYYWALTRYDQYTAYGYNYLRGFIGIYDFYHRFTVSPISCRMAS